MQIFTKLPALLFAVYFSVGDGRGTSARMGADQDLSGQQINDVLLSDTNTGSVADALVIWPLALGMTDLEAAERAQVLSGAQIRTTGLMDETDA